MVKPEKLSRRSRVWLMRNETVKNDSDTSDIMIRADAARDSGKFDLAAELYGRVPEASPSYRAALVQRGNMLKDIGNYSQAQDSYCKASTLTDDADLCLQRGHLAKLMGQLDLALEHYEAAAMRGSVAAKDEIQKFQGARSLQDVLPVQQLINANSSSLCLKRLVTPFVQAGLLDVSYYRKHYFPDKTDPEIWDEFLRAGAFNGRSYSAQLDSMAYLLSNPDLAEEDHHPVMHWASFGSSEQRNRLNRFHNHTLIPFYSKAEPKSETHQISKQRIAVHIHLYYKDFIPRFRRALSNFPFDYTLLIAHASSITEEELSCFRYLPGVTKMVTKRATNRGRNFGPLLVEFSSEVLEHELLCHIHSKKSLYSGREQVGWSSYQIEHLIGDPYLVRQHVTQFALTPELALLSTVPFWKTPYWANHWLKNERPGDELCRRLGLSGAHGFLAYPVGGMFWCRPAAFHKLFEKEWSYEDFPAEAGQTDGTLHHSIERVVSLIASGPGRTALYYEPWTNKYGRQYDILAGYRHHSPEMYGSMMGLKKLACFDVFDTVVYRASLDKQIGKKAVAKQLRKLGLASLADEFVDNRDKMELKLRKELSFAGDIQLPEIYDELVKQGCVPAELSTELQELEFCADLRDHQPREVIVNLVNTLVGRGTRVAFVSDTYYSKAQVRQLLNAAGVSKNVEIFVSSQMRARKDTGKIWNRIASETGVPLKELLHIGDNVVSDVQMPSETQVPAGLVLSVLDKASYVLGVNLHDESQRAEIIKSGNERLILAAGRDPFFRSESESKGIDNDEFQRLEDYAILTLGPLLNSYFADLVQRCQNEGRSSIGFVSREGIFLQKAFDRFCSVRSIPIKSIYIPASRSFLTKLLLDIDGTRLLGDLRYSGTVSKLFNDKLSIDETAWKS